MSKNRLAIDAGKVFFYFKKPMSTASDYGLAALDGSWLLDRNSKDATVVADFMQRWRTAIGSHDPSLITNLFAEKFTFSSPAVFGAYTVIEPVLVILDGVLKIVPDFKYVAVSFGRRNGQLHLVLEFEGHLTSLEGKVMGLQGSDFFTLDKNGLIVDFYVAIRPHSALTALMKLQKVHIDNAMASMGGSKRASKL